jgi:GNAT superfamily N-acetyltransferase
MPVVVEMSAVGRRVVIRFRRSPAAVDRPFSDVVGELVALDDDWATVRSSSGTVRVARADIVVARTVAPGRRRILDLERIAARGWRAAEVLELDGWLLRANAGWTRRANSVLPLGTPARPLPELLDEVERFYADRGTGMLIQLPLPARGVLDAELARRCWVIEAPVVLLTRSLLDPSLLDRSLLDPSLLDRPAPGIDDGSGVLLEDEPSARWQAGYRARDGRLPSAALDLLRRHENAVFASVASAGSTVGIARGTVDDGWLGVTALEVDPAARRRGVARGLMAALQDWGKQRGATHAYLQVEADNADALALYRDLGYVEHHRYHYRRPPAQAPGSAP